MRHGVKQDDLHEPLPRADGGNAELGDELLILEMQLLKAHRAQLERARAQRNTLVAVRALATESSRAKDKIVRALRKKR